MAFRTSAVSISSTATLLVAAQAGDVEVWINVDPNADYYIGGDDVTTTTGLHLFGKSPLFTTRIRPGDELWGIVTSGTVDANVLVRSA